MSTPNSRTISMSRRHCEDEKKKKRKRKILKIVFCNKRQSKERIGDNLDE